jgi:hypothetical protein
MTEWTAFMAPPELRSVPFFSTVGNHDTVDQRSANHAGPNSHETPLGLQSLLFNFANHMDVGGGHPRHTNNNLRGGGNHWARYGNTLFISLNGNANETFIVPNGEHDTFLANAIAQNTDAVWRVVTFHQDIYGGGTGHSGSGGMAIRRESWSAILDKHSIDLVINGHDHTYARSMFMRNNQVQTFQTPAALDPTGIRIFNAHPGTYVSPNGTLYLTLGSASDLPKYSSVTPMHPWVARYDPAEHDDFAQYSILTVDGDTLSVDTYIMWSNANPVALARNEPDYKHDSITLKKMADFADLTSIIASMKAVLRNDITQETWDVFRNRITEAEAIQSDAAPAAINTAFVNLYDAYYKLDPSTDKADLKSLIDEVTTVLATASEGLWEGQYQAGSIKVMQDALADAVEVYELLLATQEEIDDAEEDLETAFTHFKTLRSTTPRPWVNTHSISGTGVNTVGLLHWMDDNIPVNNHPPFPLNVADALYPRYFAHNTKVHFSTGSYVGTNSYNFQGPGQGGPRTEPQFGPANATGGRVTYGTGSFTATGHITKTHTGEWIRYELDIAQAGAYEVKLGAINKQAAAMEVRLRDTNYNTLATFNIPGGHGAMGAWDQAPMIEADKQVYLPQGTYAVELLFVNDGVSPVHNSSGNVSTYNDGPDVDILTFEYKGTMTPPDFTVPENVVILPLPPFDRGGVARRQQGWATNGSYTEHTITNSTLTVAQLREATRLVLEVTSSPRSRTIDLVFANGGGMNWEQISYNIDTQGGQSSWDLATRTITIDLRLHPLYQNWIAGMVGTGARGRVLLGYNSDTWRELNVIKAYLILGDDEPGGAVPVLWNAGGGTPAPTQRSVESGGSITAPAAITRAGYAFGGWFRNAALTEQAVFPITNVTAPVELWAKWDLLPTTGFVMALGSTANWSFQMTAATRGVFNVNEAATASVIHTNGGTADSFTGTAPGHDVSVYFVVPTNAGKRARLTSITVNGNVRTTLNKELPRGFTVYLATGIEFLGFIGGTHGTVDSWGSNITDVMLSGIGFDLYRYELTEAERLAIGEIPAAATVAFNFTFGDACVCTVGCGEECQLCLETYICGSPRCKTCRIGIGYGDIDGDTNINSADVTLLRRYIAAEDKPDFLSKNNFNRVNAMVVDGLTISARDVTMLRRWIATPANAKFILGPNDPDLCATCQLIPCDCADDQPGASPILINQVYGRGPAGSAVSHSFIELYNTSDQAYGLTGYSLQLANTVTTGSVTAIEDWKVLDLDGKTIPAKGFFLVVESGHTPPSNARYTIPAGQWDMTWDTQISNRAFSVALVDNKTKLTPVVTVNEWLNVVSFVTAQNTGAAATLDPRDIVNNQWKVGNSARCSASEAIRRIGFQETGDNSEDFRSVRYAADGDRLTDAALALLAPRWSGGATNTICGECERFTCICCGECNVYPCICPPGERKEIAGWNFTTGIAAAITEIANSPANTVFASSGAGILWFSSARGNLGEQSLDTPTVLRATTGAAGDSTNINNINARPSDDTATPQRWFAGDGSDLNHNTAAGWVIQLDTSDYTNIGFSATQYSNQHSPRDFALAYRNGISGAWIPIPLSDSKRLEMPHNRGTHTYKDFLLPAEMGGREVTQLKIYVNSLDCVSPTGGNAGKLWQVGGGDLGNIGINEVSFRGVAN